MKSKYSRLFAIAGLLLPGATYAADYEVHNVAEQITGNWASAHSDLLIGPNAVITVDGDWYVTANNVYIHPGARITGNGTLHLMNPSAYGKAAATTLFDGGGVAIGCKVSIENNSTITLTAIDPAASYPAAGITDPGGAGTNNLKLDNSLNFNNTGAYVTLGNYNVVFTSNAAAVVTRTDLNNAGFTPDPIPGNAADAYLVTSGTGTVVKEGLANAATFSYPVGQSAGSDYTPATITNTAAARDISLQVKDYAASGATEANATRGIDRTWQITGSTAGTATVALLNNAASEGTAYDHNAAFVTQQITPGNWSTGTPSLPGTPNYTQSGTFTVPVSGNTSYFSKSNDVQSSISQRMLVSPVALLQGPLSGSTMTTALNTLNLIPLSQPYTVAPFSYAGTETVASIPANVTDWVLVELRNGTTPATILATRAGFIRKDGTIVDIDGTSPIAFKGIDPGNYHIAVRHRNHLGIRTAAAQALALETPATYNFTTAATQANGTNAMVNVGSVYAMWAGDVNRDGKITNASAPSDINQVIGAVANYSGNTLHASGYSAYKQYNSNDVNMDGFIKNAAFPSDVNIIISNLANYPANTMHTTGYPNFLERLP